MTPAARRRRRLGLASVTGILLVGAAFWSLAGSRDTGGWAEVERTDLVIGVPVNGVLEASRTDRLGPPGVGDSWSFQVSYLVAEGTEVAAGTPVLRFDTSRLEQELERKLAEQEQAATELEQSLAHLEISRREAELRLAEAEGARRLAALKLDLPGDVVAASDAQVAELELELCERELEASRQALTLLERERRTAVASLGQKRDRAIARVLEIRQQIERMTVRAPNAGTVVHLSGRGGEKSRVGDSVWRGAQVLEIPDLAGIRAAGEVAEIAAGKVRRGQPATLRLDAHPDMTYAGRVASIERSVRQRSLSDPTKVVRLSIELDDVDRERMRPGMRFQGTVEIERVPQILVVPAVAVFGSPAGPTVYRLGLGGVQAVRPRLGRRSSQQVEVVEGLVEGDRVALEPPVGGAG